MKSSKNYASDIQTDVIRSHSLTIVDHARIVKNSQSSVSENQVSLLKSESTEEKFDAWIKNYEYRQRKWWRNHIRRLRNQRRRSSSKSSASGTIISARAKQRNVSTAAQQTWKMEQARIDAKNYTN